MDKRGISRNQIEYNQSTNNKKAMKKLSKAYPFTEAPLQSNRSVFNVDTPKTGDRMLDLLSFLEVRRQNMVP